MCFWKLARVLHLWEPVLKLVFLWLKSSVRKNINVEIFKLMLQLLKAKKKVLAAGGI